MSPSTCFPTYFVTIVFLLVWSTSADQVDLIQRDLVGNPFHLSWTSNNSRFDFIFSLENPIKNSYKLESIPPSTLSACVGYPACLLQNTTFIQSYYNIGTSANKIIYKSSKTTSPAPTEAQNSTVPARCKQGEVTINHYCNTHWNPPQHLVGNRCSHTIEWHSPYSCKYNTTNYERPCYVHNSNGKLIDLTPWIRSNGSSYAVDTSDYKDLKSFHLNICNEAHQDCGPNVSACLVNGETHIESGYNNLTEVVYDNSKKAVTLTLGGQYNDTCPDKRVKTRVFFTCDNSTTKNQYPKLAVQDKSCQYDILWTSVHACPVEEFQVPATQCRIKHEGSSQDIDLNRLVKNDKVIEVPGITVDGKERTMLLSICRGLSSKKYKCGGKESSLTNACLIDSNTTISDLSASNSQAISSITKSTLRLADGRLHLESIAANKSCVIPIGPEFNITKQLGTKLEFFCADQDDTKPTYLGFDGCTYLFEWGTRMMCNPIPFRAIPFDFELTKNITSSEGWQPLRPRDRNQPKAKAKGAEKSHKENMDDSKSVIASEEIKQELDKPRGATESTKSNQANSPTTSTDKSETNYQTLMDDSKMTKPHKYFMIGLISITLTAFIVIIFILDKRTRLGLTLTSIRQQARQAFQAQPTPYTRVDQFNDSLDL